MSIIVFASSKGGAGKTTSSVAIANMLAIGGRRVTLIEGDKNKAVQCWFEHTQAEGLLHENLCFGGNHGEDTIVNAIEDADAKSHNVLVDLEGRGSKATAFAMYCADFIVTPMRSSILDGTESFKVFRLIKQNEEIFKKKVLYKALFTDTSSVCRGGTGVAVENMLKEGGHPCFQNEVNSREVFKKMFLYGGGIHNLDPKKHGGVGMAMINIFDVTNELLRDLGEPELDKEICYITKYERKVA